MKLKRKKGENVVQFYQAFLSALGGIDNRRLGIAKKEAGGRDAM